MGLFKIRRELQFGVYNHPNPYPARKGELFYRGGNKGWEGYIMQSHGFSLSESLPGKRNISSFCWVGEGNGNPLHCSCLENPVDRGAWWAAVHGIAQSQTRLKRLSSSSDSDGKKSACNWGDLGSIPGLGRCPGEDNMTTHSSILACRIPMERRS